MVLLPPRFEASSPGQGLCHPSSGTELTLTPWWLGTEGSPLEHPCWSRLLREPVLGGGQGSLFLFFFARVTIFKVLTIVRY